MPTMKNRESESPKQEKKEAKKERPSLGSGMAEKAAKDIESYKSRLKKRIEEATGE